MLEEQSSACIVLSEENPDLVNSGTLGDCSELAFSISIQESVMEEHLVTSDEGGFESPTAGLISSFEVSQDWVALHAFVSASVVLSNFLDATTLLIS